MSYDDNHYTTGTSVRGTPSDLSPFSPSERGNGGSGGMSEPTTPNDAGAATTRKKDRSRKRATLPEERGKTKKKRPGVVLEELPSPCKQRRRRRQRWRETMTWNSAEKTHPETLQTPSPQPRRETRLPSWPLPERRAADADKGMSPAYATPPMFPHWVGQETQRLSISKQKLLLDSKCRRWKDRDETVNPS